MGETNEDQTRIVVVDDRAIALREDDRFAHEPLADRLADLLVSHQQPLTVGLFGPWGSGKSSVLRLTGRLLDERHDVATIEIDAWRYSEAPLARQFVSQTAEQLAAQKPMRRWAIRREATKKRRVLRARHRTWSSLYESRRSRRIQVRPEVSGLKTIFVTVVLIAVTTIAAVWIQLIADESSWQDAFKVILQRWGSVGPIILGGVAAVGLFTTEGDTTRPGSQEEFEQVLRDELARHRSWCKRVVFFVDELDRAGPEEVLATLQTIRSFLTLPSCAFVVAVDRNLLEAALLAAPLNHAGPQSATTYMGLAGSMLDKLFSVQVDMPTIRPRRLAGFALDITRREAGIWTTIDGALEDVISVLIAPHVRSPRRVKVLLNAYSVALASGRARHLAHPAEVPDLLGREVGLAVLVCLRTEFPLFAADLNERPELLPALVDLVRGRDEQEIRETYEPSVAALARTVLELQRSVEQALPTLGETQDGSPDESSTSTVLSPAERARVTELLDYLRMVDSDSLPGRDLIFGQSLGDLYGLPPSVSNEVERQALVGLPVPVELIEELDPPKRTAVANYIAAMVGSEVGVTKRRCLEALGATIPLLGEPNATIASGELSRAVVTWWFGDAPRDPSVSIAMARWANGALDAAASALLASPEWTEEDEVLTAMVAGSSWWPDSYAASARLVMPAAIGRDPDVVMTGLEGLDGSARARLWDQGAWVALGSTGDVALVRRAALTLAESDRDVAWQGVESLIPISHELGRAIAEALGGAGRTSEVRTILDAVSRLLVPAEAWAEWIDQLAAGEVEPPGQETLDANAALGTIAVCVASDASIEDTATRLSIAFHDAGGRADEALGELLPTPGSVEAATTLSRLYSSWDHTYGVPGATRTGRRAAIAAIAEGAIAVSDLDTVWLVSELEYLGRESSVEWRTSMIAPLRTVLSVDLGIYVESVLRVAPPAGELPEVLLGEMAADATPGRIGAIGVWLTCSEPTWTKVWQVLNANPGCWVAIAGSVGHYAAQLGRAKATTAVTRLLRDPRATQPILKAIDPHSVNQRTVVGVLETLLIEASNEEERRNAITKVNAIGLTTDEARRRVGSAALGLAGKSSAAALDVVRQLDPSTVGAAATREFRRIDDEVSPSFHKAAKRAIKRFWHIR